MTCPAAWNQKAYRARNDDGSETTATWIAAQNATWSQVVDSNFRIRLEVQETAACAGANKVWRLQYNKNSAGWVDCSASSVVIRASASANFTDGAATTDQLTVGTGTFIGGSGTTGGMDEGNCNAGGASMDVAASGHSEAEFCVQLRSADTVGGDTIELRITDAGTAFAAYDATASMTRSSGNVSVTPTTKALTLATFAPTVTATGGGTTVTPTTLALALTTFAPTVTTPRLVTPATLALTLTTFVPTVTVPASAICCNTISMMGV